MIRVALKAAQRDLPALVRAVEQDWEAFVLTRRGRPVAALLPVVALDALDLLGRLLPDLDEVAASPPPFDPDAAGLGPGPAPDSVPWEPAVDGEDAP